MSIHNVPDANPAFLFALCRSLHALEAEGYEVGGFDDLYRRVGIGVKGRVKACFDSAKTAGILVDAEDCDRDMIDEGFVLADHWRGAFAPNSTPLDFSLCANRNLARESKSWGLLWHVAQRLFEEQVLGEMEPFDRVLERWNEAAHDAPEISTKSGVPMDELSRWLYFLGWIRRFGPRQMVPDFSPWLLGWLDRNPREGTEDAGDFWAALQQALPVASTCSLESEVPEALSVALFTLESRQLVQFRRVSDSPKPLMRLGVASKKAEAHELVWSGGKGR